MAVCYFLPEPALGHIEVRQCVAKFIEGKRTDRAKEDRDSRKDDRGF